MNTELVPVWNGDIRNKYRGLLLCCDEAMQPPTHDAPPVSYQAAAQAPAKDAADDRVLAVLSPVLWTPTPLVAAKCHRGISTTGKILLRLYRAGVVERVLPKRASFRDKRATEWRRAR